MLDSSEFRDVTRVLPGGFEGVESGFRGSCFFANVLALSQNRVELFLWSCRRGGWLCGWRSRLDIGRRSRIGPRVSSRNDRRGNRLGYSIRLRRTRRQQLLQTIEEIIFEAAVRRQRAILRACGIRVGIPRRDAGLHFHNRTVVVAR